MALKSPCKELLKKFQFAQTYEYNDNTLQLQETDIFTGFIHPGYRLNNLIHSFFLKFFF